jgi:hypothetical protein
MYNEERILPFFIDHYRKLVSKFVFYDNSSSDNSVAVIRNAGINHEIFKFDTSEQFDELYLTRLRNNIWKQSKSANVDYVIVCDTDEFLYHADIDSFLKTNRERGVTIFKPEGYNMFSAEFPSLETGAIVSQVKRGVRANRQFSGSFGLERFDKCILFSPDYIDNIDFGTGSHDCNPTGTVVYSEYEGLKLLHYKALSLPYLLGKMESLRTRIPQQQKDMGLNYHYFNQAADIERDFWDYLRQATDVI